MRKIYFLKTCDTCKRIIKSLPNTDGFIFQDIKEEPISAKQLEEMYALTNNYEGLFSKRAKLYKEMGLKDEVLQEKIISEGNDELSKYPSINEKTTQELDYIKTIYETNY